MKKHRRALSLVLALVMALALLPGAAMAATGERKPSEVFACLPANPAPVTPPTYEEVLNEWYGGSHEGPFWNWWMGDYEMDLKAVYTEIVSLVNSLTKGKTSETAKAKAIYQWVANNISYISEVSGYPLEVYFTRKTTCEGYTNLSNLMQRLAGLPAAEISSDPDWHAWSAVYADGRWIMYDSTQKQWDFAPDAGLFAKKHISEISYVDGNGPWKWTIFNGDEAIDIGVRYMYGENSSPEQVVVPEGVTVMRFANILGTPNIPESVTGIILPGTLKKIEGSAFRGYKNLTSISVPESVIEIEDHAFKDCTNLKSITLPDNLKELGGCKYYQETLGGNTFDGCTSLSSVEIPAGVTELLLGTFNGCTSLTSVTLPAGLTKIEWYTFNGCSSLKDVWFCGTKEQWDAIEIDSRYNDALENATVHYNSIYSTGTAYASTQTVDVDGKPVEFAMYALNGGSTNYIRVRDLAAALNGTSAQFNVGWNGNVTLTGKTPYDGSTDKAPFATPMVYTVYTAPTYVDGKAVDLKAIQIEYNGGGFTYYKLRDLAQALNFNVGWSADRGVFVETDKPYDPNN